MPNKYILITTSHCPKCPLIKKVLTEKLGDNLVVIDETDKDFNLLIDKYNLISAPSLIDLDKQEVVDIDTLNS